MTSYARPKLRQTITEALFRRKRLFLTTVCIVFGLTLLLTFLMPRRYASEAKLMVQNVRSSTPLGTEPTDRQISPNEVSVTEINSEVDLLQSRGVARLALGQNLSQPEDEAQEKSVSKLEHHLTVDSVHQTDLIDVRLLGSSPDQATAQLRKVLAAYFEERGRAAGSTGAAAFFDRQAEQKGQQLEQDQQALASFQMQHQIADLDDQKKLQITRIAAIQDQLAATDGALARQMSKRAAENRQLSMVPPRSKTVERSITNQYSQERLNTSLVDLENRRTELLKRYPPTDRQVVEINEKIATTRQAAAAASDKPATEEASDVNPVWEQLKSSVVTSSGEVSGTEAQRGQLVQQLKQAQARLNELEESTAPNDALKRRIAQTQADYTLYAQRRDQARIAEELDKQQMFDVSLVQEPMASPDPVRPKPLLYLASGLVFALLLGALLALYADTSADYVYTPSQLDELTGMRTIATFADEEGTGFDPEANRLEYRRILFAIRNALGQAQPAAVGVERPAMHASVAADLEARSGLSPSAVAMDVDAEPLGFCIGFTSALAGEGVSQLVGNLAMEAAIHARNRVAVLDMAALLEKFESDVDVVLSIRYDEARQYWILAFEDDDERARGYDGDIAQRQKGTQAVFATRLRALLLQARRDFDFLFLDCPSLQESTLAVELELCLDAYIAVVSAGYARRQNIDQMAAVLGESRPPLLGYVLTRRRYPLPAWLYRLLW